MSAPSWGVPANSGSSENDPELAEPTSDSSASTPGGPRPQAYPWYVPLPADELDGATPDGLVKSGSYIQILEPDTVIPSRQVALGRGSASRRRRKHGRAGRNLPAAVAVGALLGGLVVASLYLYKPLFVALTVVTTVIAIWELVNALAVRHIRPPVAPLVIGSGTMLMAAYAGGAEALAIATALTVLAIMVWQLLEGRERYLQEMSSGIFAVMYVPFLASFGLLMLSSADGGRRVLTFVLITACSDVAGYVTGVLVGRHPLAPKISPRKSWEGLAGSAVCCGIAGAVLLPVLLDGPVWQGVVFGLAVTLSATLGDLGESMIKRDLGIKDMGSLLPGHGGILDRLDSLLATAPLAWLLLTVFVA